MTETQVYTMQANSEDDMSILNDPQQRKLFVAFAVTQAKSANCHVLSILDLDGKEIYVEVFGPTEEQLTKLEAEFDARQNNGP